MRNKLNILQIVPKSTVTSGGPRQALDLACALAECGHSVFYVCRPLKRPVKALSGDNPKLIQIPMKNEWDLASIQALYRLMKLEQIDVAHVHKGLAHTLAYPAAVWAKVPAFVVNRGVSFPLDIFNRIKYKWRRVGAIVVVCEQIKEILIKSGRINPNKIKVIYGGTDLEKFDFRIKPDKIRREFSLCEKNIVIGKIAAVRTWKGHKLLLEAAARIIAKSPQARFLIVGEADNTLAYELKQMAVDLSIADKVIFTGYRSDIPDIIAACDFTVNCSSAGEGLTGALRESLAMKKLAIATDVGGNREIIINKKTGILIPANNMDALIDAMDYLINSEERRVNMGQAGYELVKENFTEDIKISKIEKLYNDLVSCK